MRSQLVLFRGWTSKGNALARLLRGWWGGISAPQGEVGSGSCTINNMTGSATVSDLKGKVTLG